MESRRGLLVDFRVAETNGRAEREVALAMLDENKARRGPATVGAEKGYDTHNFVAECRAMNVVPHIARIVNEYRGLGDRCAHDTTSGWANSTSAVSRVWCLPPLAAEPDA